MIQKLKDISSIIIIPAAILYFFGFLVITSYLSRFGFVDFDIINARFLIAGIYPLISLFIVIWGAWKIYENKFFKSIFQVEDFKKRILSYVYYLTAFSITTTAMTALFNLGKYHSRTQTNNLEFNYLFKNYDFIGDFIQHLTNSSGSYDFIIKWGLYVFIYLVIIYLIIIIFIIILPKVIKDKPETQEENVVIPSIDKKVTTKSTNRILNYLVPVVDIFFMCFFISLLIFSYIKIHSSSIDFQTLNTNLDLSYGLVFSWFYSSTISTYLFFHIMKLEKENLSLSLLKNFKDPSDIQANLQSCIIPILAALFLFGSVIFPRIPFSIGGGQARKVTLQTNTSTQLEGQLFLVGENNQFMFVTQIMKDTTEAYQINKNTIQFVKIQENNQERMVPNTINP